MALNYRVVTDGTLLAGTTPEQFISAFSQLFKVPEEQAQKILSAKQTITLKNNIDRDTAEKFQRVLQEQAGLEVRIEEIAELSLVEERDVNDASTSASVSGSHSGIHCPKCGSDQVSDDTCQACGIIISKYRAHQAQTGDDASSNESGWNPYQSTATEAVEDEEGFTIRKVSTGDAWQWIVGGWRLFVKNPLAWIGTIIIWYLIMFVANFIPFVGSIATSLLSPVFMAGIMIGANAQAEGGSFSVSHLFEGFSRELSRLLLAGLLYLAAFFGVAIVFGILFAVSGMGMALAGGGHPGAMAGGISVAFIAVLVIVVFIVMALISMAFYYVPLLIVFDNQGPVEAITQSFSACWKNIITFIVYGLIIIGLAIVAAIPIGLGLLVLIPVALASIYISYRQIFHGEA